MSTDCPSEAVLGRYAIGALSEADAGAVNTHLSGCVTCLDLMGTLDKSPDAVLAALRHLPRAVPAASPTMARAVAAAAAATTPAPAADLAAGAVLNGYRVAEELGRGGMGRVYRAAHP